MRKFLALIGLLASVGIASIANEIWYERKDLDRFDKLLMQHGPLTPPATINLVQRQLDSMAPLIEDIACQSFGNENAKRADRLYRMYSHNTTSFAEPRPMAA